MLLSSNEIHHRYSVGACKEIIYKVCIIPTCGDDGPWTEIQIYM